MNLSKNIQKKYLIILLIAPLILFSAGLSIEKLIKFNGDCYHYYGISSHFYKCGRLEYLKNDVLKTFLSSILLGLPLYFLYFLIPISIVLLTIFISKYIYRKLKK